MQQQRSCFSVLLLLPLERQPSDFCGAIRAHAQVIEGTAKLHSCTADLKWSEQAYIPTVNDARVVARVEEAARKLVGAARWQRMAEPTMAAEDFGFLAGTLSVMQPVHLSRFLPDRRERITTSATGAGQAAKNLLSRRLTLGLRGLSQML